MRCGIATLIVLAGCGSATIGDPPQVELDAGAAPPDATTVTLLDARSCDGGDASVRGGDGTCYVYFEDQVTWGQAAIACAARGGTLAAPTSDAEVGLLAALPIDLELEPDAWLGATDAEDEMDWQWLSGDPWSYENWRDGEPNDGASDTVAEDCMVLEADNGGTWDDRPCDREYPYLCEE